MAGYNFHYYLDDYQAELKKEERTSTTIILWVRKGQFKIKYRTSIKVKPDQWDGAKQEVRRNKIGYASDNNYLLTVKALAQDIFIEKSKAGVPLTHQVLKQALDEKLGIVEQSTKNNLLKFAENFIEQSELTKGIKTIKSYRTTLNRLTDFIRKYNYSTTFETVTLEFYTKFVSFLIKDKNHSINGAGTHIKNLKVFLHESYDFDLHNNKIFANRKFKALQQETYPIYLTMKEIGQIYRHDFSYSPRLERVRDIFIFACMTGLRFSDYSRLRADNIKGKYIEIVPQKTHISSPLPILIPILEYVPEIIRKYKDDQGRILPRVPTNQKMNEFLKEIGELAKINEMVKNPNYSPDSPPDVKPMVPKFTLISTHTARRSFATNSYEKNINPIDIMKITGHSTERSFMRYIRHTPKQAADRVADGWNNE